MKQTGMIFVDELILALLSGKKAQTRRPVSTITLARMRELALQGEVPHLDAFGKFPEAYQAMLRPLCPFGQIGDLIYARETYLPDPPSDHDAWDDPESLHTFYSWEGCGATVKDLPDPLKRREYVLYRASWDNSKHPLKWRPSIHMPKWAARAWLEITGLTFERLQDITVQDALAEGIDHKTMNCPRHEFFQLWDSMYGEGHAAENPFVWKIEFKLVEPPEEGPK